MKPMIRNNEHRNQDRGRIKRFFSAILAVALGGAVLAPLEARWFDGRKPGTPPVIEIAYRALEPGEVILASYKSGQGIRKAFIRFRGRNYPLSGQGESGGFAFIGLDLTMEPGLYPMEITAERTGGRRDVIRREIVINRKEFPSKKLWVDPDYAVPPKEVEERIAREAELVAAVYSVVTPHWLGNGDFIVPHEGEPSPNFGQRRIFNDKPRSTHTGVDLAVPFGEPIKAANSGKVVLAGELYMSGKTVIIDHGLGVFSMYGHMSEILVKRGAPIEKGAVMGRCGSTGRSTGPHLHWGIRVLDARVDPFSFLGLGLSSR